MFLFRHIFAAPVPFFSPRASRTRTWLTLGLSLVLGGALTSPIFAADTISTPNDFIHPNLLLSVRASPDKKSQIFLFWDHEKSLYQILLNRQGQIFVLSQPLTPEDKRMARDIVSGSYRFRLLTELTPTTLTESTDEFVFNVYTRDNDGRTTVSETNKIRSVESAAHVQLTRQGVLARVGENQFLIQMPPLIFQIYGPNKSVDDFVRLLRPKYEAYLARTRAANDKEKAAIEQVGNFEGVEAYFMQRAIYQWGVPLADDDDEGWHDERIHRYMEQNPTVYKAVQVAVREARVVERDAESRDMMEALHHVVEFYALTKTASGHAMSKDEAAQELGFNELAHGGLFFVHHPAPDSKWNESSARFNVARLITPHADTRRKLISVYQRDGMVLLSYPDVDSSPEEIRFTPTDGNAVVTYSWQHFPEKGADFETGLMASSYLPDSMADSFSRLFPDFPKVQIVTKSESVGLEQTTKALSLKPLIEILASSEWDQARIVQYGNTRVVIVTEPKPRVLVIGTQFDSYSHHQQVKEALAVSAHDIGLQMPPGFDSKTPANFLGNLYWSFASAELRIPAHLLESPEEQKQWLTADVKSTVQALCEGKVIAASQLLSAEAGKVLQKLSPTDRDLVSAEIVDLLLKFELAPIRKAFDSPKVVALELPIENFSVSNTQAGSFEDFQFTSLGQSLRFQVPLATSDAPDDRQVHQGLIPNPETPGLNPCAADACVGLKDSDEWRKTLFLQPVHHLKSITVSFGLHVGNQGPNEEMAQEEPWRESLDIPEEFGGDSASDDNVHRNVVEIKHMVEALPVEARHLARFQVLLDLQNLSSRDQITLVNNIVAQQRVSGRRADSIRALLFPESTLLPTEQVSHGFTEFIRASRLPYAGFEYAMTEGGSQISPCQFTLMKNSKK